MGELITHIDINNADYFGCLLPPSSPPHPQLFTIVFGLEDFAIAKVVDNVTERNSTNINE